MSRGLVVLGGGGHACVLLEILARRGMAVRGLADIERPNHLPEAVPFLGNDESVLEFEPSTMMLINGIGSTSSTKKRRRLYELFREKDYRFASVTHPAAVLATQGMELGEGLQIMAGAVINTDCRIGENVLINSGAIVEHDCRVGQHTHIASGAVVCGGCDIGEGAHIGAGSTIIQGVNIGDGAIIAAGAVVTRDVKPMTLVAGVPAVEKRIMHDD